MVIVKNVITNVVFVKIVVITVPHARLEDLKLQIVNVLQDIMKYVVKVRQTIVVIYVKIHNVNNVIILVQVVLLQLIV